MIDVTEQEQEHVDLEIQYRLLWDAPKLEQQLHVEKALGDGCWPKLSEDQWNRMEWSTTETMSFDLAEIADVRATYELWSQTREKPVRNVRLQRRSTLVGGDWEPIVP